MKISKIVCILLLLIVCISSFGQNTNEEHIRKNGAWMCFDSTAMQRISDSIIEKRRVQAERDIYKNALSNCQTDMTFNRSIIFDMKRSEKSQLQTIADLHSNESVNLEQIKDLKNKNKRTTVGSVFITIGAVLLTIVFIK